MKIKITNLNPLKGKPVNPYFELADYATKHNNGQNRDWVEFEANNPELPISNPYNGAKIGDEVEGELVWQYKERNTNIWKSCTHYSNLFYENNECKTRPAYEITIPETIIGVHPFGSDVIETIKTDQEKPVVSKMESVEDLAENAASEYATTPSEFSTYKEIFIAGHTHPTNIPKQKVVELIKEWRNSPMGIEYLIEKLNQL